MKTREIVVLDHRCRCRYCGDYVSKYCAAIGVSYSTSTYIRGTNKGQRDYNNRDTYDTTTSYGKLLRENSLRGSGPASSFLFKKHKDIYGSYRYIVYCECGNSTWMFAGPDLDPNQNNRKLDSNYFKYEYRRKTDINVKY